MRDIEYCIDCDKKNLGEEPESACILGNLKAKNQGMPYNYAGSKTGSVRSFLWSKCWYIECRLKLYFTRSLSFWHWAKCSHLSIRVCDVNYLTAFEVSNILKDHSQSEYSRLIVTLKPLSPVDRDVWSHTRCPRKNLTVGKTSHASCLRYVRNLQRTSLVFHPSGGIDCFWISSRPAYKFCLRFLSPTYHYALINLQPPLSIPNQQARNHQS